MSSLKKNVASQNVTFGLVSATDGSAKTGATVTVYVTKDNGTQASGGGTVTEAGHGQYNYAPTQAETNATDVGFLFTATSAIPLNLDFHTDVVDANGYPSMNVVDWNGTAVASPATAGIPDINVKNINNVSTSSVTTVKAVQGLTTADTIATYTGNTPQTGDAYARLGAPAGASVSADVAAVKTDTAGIKTQTDKLAFTVTNKVDANVLDINGNAGSAAALQRSTYAICTGSVGSSSTTTNVVVGSVTPSMTAVNQFKGRVLIFDQGTTTTNLRGQATVISANDASGNITVAALTNAPVSGDTFTIT